MISDEEARPDACSTGGESSSPDPVLNILTKNVLRMHTRKCICTHVIQYIYLAYIYVYMYSVYAFCGILLPVDKDSHGPPGPDRGGDQRGRPLAEESIFYSQPLSGGMCACIRAFYYSAGSRVRSGSRMYTVYCTVQSSIHNLYRMSNFVDVVLAGFKIKSTTIVNALTH